MQDPKRTEFDPDPGLGDELAQEVIRAVSERLKREYDALVVAPVPDRFVDLLNQLSDAPADIDAETASDDPADQMSETSRQEGPA